VVSAQALADPDVGGRLLAHELGHARGLSHTSHGVMTSGGPACTDGFTAEQLRMRTD
jgi:hypothetical protein